MEFHEARNITYTFGMVVTALITAMGMQAENQARTIVGESPAYVEKDFIAVINDNVLGHNSLLTSIDGY